MVLRALSLPVGTAEHLCCWRDETDGLRVIRLIRNEYITMSTPEANEAASDRSISPAESDRSVARSSPMALQLSHPQLSGHPCLPLKPRLSFSISALIGSVGDKKVESNDQTDETGHDGDDDEGGVDGNDHELDGEDCSDIDVESDAERESRTPQSEHEGLSPLPLALGANGTVIRVPAQRPPGPEGATFAVGAPGAVAAFPWPANPALIKDHRLQG